MVVFRFLVLSTIGINFCVKAGGIVYPNPSIIPLNRCVAILSELGISPDTLHKSKVIGAFKEVLEHLDSNAQLDEQASTEFQVTMGRRRGMNHSGDWSKVKLRLDGFIRDLEKGSSVSEHSFYLEGAEQLERLRGMKSQIPRLFSVEKKILWAAGGLGAVSCFAPPNFASASAFFGGILLAFELLFRSAIFVSVNHQFKYDFVEYLVDCARKIDNPQASPVVLSYFDSQTRYLDAVMVPGENPKFALVISKRKSDQND